MISRMSQLNFWACATVGRAGARKYLFLAHVWALLGMGRIVMAGMRGGGGGTAAWEPNWVQILGLGQYNLDTANAKGGYAGKETGMPRRGVKESSVGQRALRMTRGEKETLATQILRQQDETRGRMQEPKEDGGARGGAAESGEGFGAAS